MGLPAPAPLASAALERTVGAPPRAGTVSEHQEEPHLAAIQRSDEYPTRYVADHRISRVGAMDAVYLANFPNWQDYIRRWGHTLHLVRFVGSIVADTLSRCDLMVQYRGDNGEWVDVDQAWTASLFDHYDSERYTTQELLRLHAWFYETVGDMYQVVRDGDGGQIDWMLYSANAVRFNRDSALILDLPNGSVRTGTAFTVPRTQVRRFWTPDEEWQGWATSPMAAVVNDLHLYESLIRYYRNTADSAVAMNGVLWIPGEAVRSTGAGQGDEPGQSVGPGATKGRSSGGIIADYYESAARRLTNADSVAAVAAFVMHWNKDYGPPQYVKVGEGLDPHGIAYLQEARMNFARGVNIPGQLVESGGTADGNHWNAWLVQEDYFKTIAPIEERLCRDLTRTFLWYALALLGVRDFRRYRVWYDPAPVIVRPDQGSNAIALAKIGLLNFEKVLETFGYDQNDLMPPDQVRKIISILSAGHSQPGTSSGSGLPIGAGNVAQQPPPGGPQSALPAGQPAPAQQGAVHIHVNGHRQMDLDEELRVAAAEQRRPDVVRRADRALTAVMRSRRDTGREIRAIAETTFRAALERGNTKVLNRAGTRASRGVQTRAAAAVERLRTDPGEIGPDGALRPHLAAVGITEEEMFRGAFTGTFADDVRRALSVHARRVNQALAENGFDPSLSAGGDDHHIAEAAAFLTAGLTALAIMRSADGHPLMPTTGEVSGAVPASFARQTLAIADGAAGQVPATRPDQLPDVIFIPDQDLTQRIAEAVGQDPEVDGEPEVSYTWNWAFYGDPNTPFEPHENLGASGFTTTDIENDPDLANTEGWPEVDFYAPDDHEGCSCEWVPTIEARYAQEPSRSMEPGRSIPGLGGNADQTQRALDAAGVG